MREITMPEVKLPDIRLPEGLREMSRDDIVQAAHDVRSSMHMPKKIDMPDIDLSKVDLSRIDLSKVELPRQLTDRLPQRRRRNPLLPIAGVLAVGAMIAGVWFLQPIADVKCQQAILARAFDLRSAISSTA